MDSLIAASARALAAGDPLGALQHVALREDAAALALRGTAMAQLGELALARDLLRRARRKFAPAEAVARARCVVAEAEVALALRDLCAPPATLGAAAAALARHGDRFNAWHARLLQARGQLLVGRLVAAAALLEEAPAGGLPPPLAALASLLAAEVALRTLRCGAARAALAQAAQAARRSGVPALQDEVEELQRALERPAARCLEQGRERTMRLREVEALLASGALVLDGCRRGIAGGGAWLPLARRPVLFALAEALARAWPQDVARDPLIATAFRARRIDETHRARLRVEIGRLRALVRPFARIEATPAGFVLRTMTDVGVAVLAPPIAGGQAALQALLADGAAWSTSALALALGASQRTVQRALAELEQTGQVRAHGQARARRWLAPPLADFTTILLLPAALPGA